VPTHPRMCRRLQGFLSEVRKRRADAARRGKPPSRPKREKSGGRRSCFRTNPQQLLLSKFASGTRGVRPGHAPLHEALRHTGKECAGNGAWEGRAARHKAERERRVPMGTEVLLLWRLQLHRRWAQKFLNHL